MNTIKQLIHTSAMGTKGIIDSTTNIADNTLSKIKQSTEISSSASSTPIIQSIPAPTQLSINQPNQLPNQNMPPLDVAQANTLNRALNSTQPENRNVSQDNDADDSYSKIQNLCARPTPAPPLATTASWPRGRVCGKPVEASNG